MRKILCSLFVVFVAAGFTSGCATTGTDGVVPIGPDLYMVGGHGSSLDHSGSGVKAKFFREASKFCEDKGRVMLPVNSTGQDAGFYTFASAEVQFRCVQPSDPRAK
jgi:hypothetical protein